MVLDLGRTTRPLLSVLNDAALVSHTHAQRLNGTRERGLNISTTDAAGLNYPDRASWNWAIRRSYPSPTKQGSVVTLPSVIGHAHRQLEFLSVAVPRRPIQQTRGYSAREVIAPDAHPLQVRQVLQRRR